MHKEGFMNKELFALTEKSASTDLVFLLKAKEGAKERMKNSPTQENINAFQKSKDAMEKEKKRLEGSADKRMNVYKSQIDTVAFLEGRGYKISKSSFNRDVKKNIVSTTDEGHFEENSLLAYAMAFKTPTGSHEDKKLTHATKDKISHEARLKKFQTDRLQIKLEKEQGKIISRSRHEQELGARALFFKREIENFIHLYGPGIIHIVGGDEEKLPILTAHWDEITADWMNIWSNERQFVASSDIEEEEDEASINANAKRNSDESKG